MKTTTTYKGTIDGVYGIYCGFRPKGLKLDEKVTVYHPDEDKIFKKGDEYFDCVILQEGEEITDYEEVDKPEEQHIIPEPQE